VLFDTGSGTGFMPSPGQIATSLVAIGRAPGDITHVVFTHGHPDPLRGATDDFEEPFCVNARHLMAEAEHDDWSDPATVDRSGAARQSFAAAASRRLDLLGGAVELFGAGDEPVPGITAVATPGHTPGHMSSRLGGSGGSGGAFVIGDAIGNSHLALARPDRPSPADRDPAQGRDARAALLEELSASGETVAGFHMDAGGIGTLAGDGRAYRCAPA